MDLEDDTMNVPTNDCQTVRESAGEFLDGRLERSARDQIRAHLGSCDPCKAEFRVLHRLSQLAARQPVIAPPHELADRVRGVLHQRRGSVLARLGTPRIKTAWTRVAAAVLLLPSAATVGYLLGRESQDAPTTTVAETHSGVTTPPEAQPISHTGGNSESPGLRPVDPLKAYKDEGFKPELFIRAGRQLLADLNLDRLDPDISASLVQSELDYFDLGEQANRFLAVDSRVPHSEHSGVRSIRSLAHIINNLNEIAPDMSRDPAILARSRRELRKPAMLTSLNSLPYVAPQNTAPPANKGRLRRVVEDHAPRLVSEQKDSLVTLLELKHNVVHGRFEDFFLFVSNENIERATNRRPPDILCDPHVEDAMCVLLASALPEFGLGSMAHIYRDKVDSLPQVFITMSRPRFVPRRGTPDLEQLMHGFHQHIQHMKASLPDETRQPTLIQMPNNGIRMILQSEVRSGVFDLHGLHVEFTYQEGDDVWPEEAWIGVEDIEIEALEADVPVQSSVDAPKGTRSDDGR